MEEKWLWTHQIWSSSVKLQEETALYHFVEEKFDSAKKVIGEKELQNKNPKELAVRKLKES